MIGPAWSMSFVGFAFNMGALNMILTKEKYSPRKKNNRLNMHQKK